MAISDLLEFADFIDLVRSWRFLVPALIGVCAAIWLYSSFNGSTLGTALAAVVGLAGVVAGFLWQHRHERPG